MSESEPPTPPSPGSGGELAIGAPFAGYVIDGIAGRGGMGVVYRARQLRPSRLVALKVISPQLAGHSGFRERFAHESEIAASIEHSNVIPVYEVGEESERLFIAMRYVEGTDLGAVIAAEGRISPARAVRILSELAAALDAAHAHGLVHRDVKPANILIAHQGGGEHVYLTDFGLAKLATDAGMTRTGMFVGTLDYAAPEQIEARPVDARTDVYAAGCVLYHMLTGSVPFPHESEAATMWAHVSAAPPSARELVPALPARLDQVIARAMAKAPDDRYPSAGDLARDAMAAAEGELATVVERSVATGRAAPAAGPAATAAAATEATTGVTTATATETPPPRAPRRAVLSWRAVLGAGAVIAVVLVLLAVSGVFSTGGHRARSRPQAHAGTTTPAPTTSTYGNAALGVSFSYPESWRALNLKGSVADFGTQTAGAETRCALTIERGGGPASSSQEARFAFVRARSAYAAKVTKHYVLQAIQAEHGANIVGVGLLRTFGDQGGHIGFFFRRRDVYVFDCITVPAANLASVDQRDFRPLLASVRIG